MERQMRSNKWRYLIGGTHTHARGLGVVWCMIQITSFPLIFCFSRFISPRYKKPASMHMEFCFCFYPPNRKPQRKGEGKNCLGVTRRGILITFHLSLRISSLSFDSYKCTKPKERRPVNKWKIYASSRITVVTTRNSCLTLSFSVTQ